MDSKSPIVEPAPALNGYFFGYGGISFGGGGQNTTGSFTRNADPATTDALAAGGIDPFNIPIDFDLRDSWNYGVGLGLYSSFLGGTRLEIEGASEKTDIGTLRFAGFLLPSSFQFKTNAVMVNFLKEFPLYGGAIGYTGFGLGHASTEMRGDIGGVPYGEKSHGFAWQFLLGIDVPVTERLALFTQYRYRVLPELTYFSEFGDFYFTTNDQPSNHALQFGARLSF